LNNNKKPRIIRSGAFLFSSPVNFHRYDDDNILIVEHPYEFERVFAIPDVLIKDKSYGKLNGWNPLSKQYERIHFFNKYDQEFYITLDYIKKSNICKSIEGAYKYFSKFR
jgi:hypothetical protein